MPFPIDFSIDFEKGSVAPILKKALFYICFKGDLYIAKHIYTHFCMAYIRTYMCIYIYTCMYIMYGLNMQIGMVGVQGVQSIWVHV